MSYARRRFWRVVKRLADVYARGGRLARGRVRLRLAVARRLRGMPGMAPELISVAAAGDGLKFWLSPSSSVGAFAWACGVFDAPGITACVEALKDAKGGLMLDIGANVGVFSIFAATKVDRLKVIAIEANPSAMQLLRRNLVEHAPAVAARGSTVEAIEAALGAEDGVAGFFASDDDSASSLTHHRHLTGRPVQVPMWRGDALLAQRGWPEVALCKLDVEGGEMVVLRGLKEALRRRCIRRLRMEINLVCCASAGHAPEDLIALLGEQGYRMTEESQRRYGLAGWDCEDFVFEPARSNA